MSDTLSAEEEVRLNALARAAGLGPALARFPEDLRSSFRAAAEFRRGLGPDLQPADEPWSPRTVADRSD